jgi:hypothetical protein
MNHIPQFDGIFKTNIVHRYGHAWCITMLSGCNAGGNIHPVHQSASHQVAERIGIVGQYQLIHDGQTFDCFFGFHARFIFGKVPAFLLDSRFSGVK